MSDYCLYVVIMNVLILCGCACHRQSGEPSAGSIVGQWETDEADGEWGRAKGYVTFSADGKVRFRTIFPHQDPPGELTHEGNYWISGDKLTSDAMNKGKPVRVWFDRGDLMLQIDDEPPGRFHRVPQ